MSSRLTIAEDPTVPIWPQDYGVPFSHCREVLQGCYDVPYHPKEPPIILDLGANIGAFAWWATRRWPGSTIYCYEPHPDNFKLLERTIASLQPADIVADQVAILNSYGEAPLYTHGKSGGEYTLAPPKQKADSVTVRLIPAYRLPKANVLKIDTEGAELAILDSLYNRLSEFSAVMLEVHSDLGLKLIPPQMKRAGFVGVGRTNHSQFRAELKFMRPEAITQ